VRKRNDSGLLGNGFASIAIGSAGKRHKLHRYGDADEWILRNRYAERKRIASERVGFIQPGIADVWFFDFNRVNFCVDSDR
jgi:hypothetical protein